MIHIHSNGNRVAYGIKHFDLDTLLDMSNLNKDKLYPGSTIFIINTSEYYMLNGNKQWIKINPYGIGNSSESDSGGSESENEEISYDGGSIDDSDPV